MEYWKAPDKEHEQIHSRAQGDRVTLGERMGGPLKVWAEGSVGVNKDASLGSSSLASHSARRKDERASSLMTAKTLKKQSNIETDTFLFTRA